MEIKKDVAVLWNNRHERLEVHIFTMEPPGKSRYRALISWSYFRSREADKCNPKNRGKYFDYRTHGMDLRDHETNLEAENRIFAPKQSPLSKVPVFEHESIWDMYKALGYDYKRKRYTRQIAGETNGK